MHAVPRLADYDLVLVNSSAGKDSQAMLTYLVGLAREQDYPLTRFVVVHADLGRVEWEGTRDLAAQQAACYGLRFEAVSRDRDLLDQIEHERGMFPSSTARFCTSDQKTAQVAKLMTRLTREAWEQDPDRHADCQHGKPRCDAPVRILNCLGIRAQESPARAKKEPWTPREKASNTLKHVDRWLPIFDWTARTAPGDTDTPDDVWTTILDSGVPYHTAYDAGMPRLSCVFCVLAGERELVLAARLNPDLAATYAAVEQRIDFRFKKHLSMAQIREKAADPTYSTDRERPAADLQPCLF